MQETGPNCIAVFLPSFSLLSSTSIPFSQAKLEPSPKLNRSLSHPLRAKSLLSFKNRTLTDTRLWQWSISKLLRNAMCDSAYAKAATYVRDLQPTIPAAQNLLAQSPPLRFHIQGQIVSNNNHISQPQASRDQELPKAISAMQKGPTTFHILYRWLYVGNTQSIAQLIVLFRLNRRQTDIQSMLKLYLSSTHE